MFGAKKTMGKMNGDQRKFLKSLNRLNSSFIFEVRGYEEEKGHFLVVSKKQGHTLSPCYNIKGSIKLPEDFIWQGDAIYSLITGEKMANVVNSYNFPPFIEPNVPWAF